MTKKPPLSIRLPDAVMAEVDAWATVHGVPRNAAIRALVELGLGAKVEATAPAKAQPARVAKSEPSSSPSLQIGPVRPAFGARLKKR
jgi:hypothetical protein